MNGDWMIHRTKVLGSKLLSDVLETLEKYDVEETEESYKLTINQKEDAHEGEAKSQYRVAEDLKKKYPSIVRALSRLEQMSLITRTQNAEKGKRTPIIFAWTYKAVILFPEIAPLDSLSGTYNEFFGDWKDCAHYFSDLVKCEEDEAEAILTFLCWTSRSFLRWVRDEIILPLDERGEGPPDPDNHEYWRQLAMRNLVKEYLIHMIQNPQKYFDEAFRNIPKEKLGISNSLFNGLKKVLKFGENLLSGIEIQNLKYIS